MRKLLLLALLFLSSAALAQYTGSFPQGMGASTLRCIDVDGDGYGTGPGCLGPDADDKDASVHTIAQATTKWGSVQAFMTHLYSTVGASTRYWVISTTGNDGTCASRTFTTQANPTLAPACSTWAHVAPLVLAGDIIFWRGGTYTEEIQGFNAVGGAAGSPVGYMSYPGELATIDAISGMDVCASGLTPQNRDYLIIDGFKFIYSADNINGGNAVTFCYNHNLTVRHVEVGQGHGTGLFGGSGGSDWLIEYNVTHDQNLYGVKAHGIYLVNRSDQPTNANSIFRNNLCWNPGRTCIQNTGVFSNLTLDGNVAYNLPFDSAAGFSWEQQVHNSYVRNNLCFNADVKCFVIAVYESTIATNLPGDMNNNVIENNTFVIPKYKWEDGTSISPAPNINVGVTAPGIACGSTYDLGHNTFRSNLLINKSGGPTIYFLTFSGDANGTYQGNGPDPRSWSNTTVWQSNDFWQQGTSGQLYYSNSAGTIGSPPCSFGLIQGYQNYATFLASAGAGTTGNISSDPQFTAYQDSYWSTPASFDFRLLGASPFINSGTTTGATYDLLGHKRTATPSIGAYQYASGGTAIPLNTWVSPATHGATCSDNGWNRDTYAPNVQKMFMFGFYKESSTEPNQSLCAYDFNTNAWQVWESNGIFHSESAPESGHNESFDYNVNNGLLEWFCCSSGSNAPENLYHMRQYDPVGLANYERQPTPRPNMSEYQHSSCMDAANNKFVLYNSSVLATWIWDPVAMTWGGTVPAGTPPPQFNNGSMRYNPDDGKCYYFGGLNTAYSNDIYTFTEATNTWAKLTPSGTPPSARSKACMAYDTLNKRFIVTGGENGSGLLTDTFIFDPTSGGSWSAFAGSAYATPTAAPWSKCDYNSDANVLELWDNTTGGNAALAYADGGSSLIDPIRLHLLRIGGTGPNVGTLTNAVTATSSGINHNVLGWATNPALAPNGTDLYSLWGETGVSEDRSNGAMSNPWAKKWNGTSWDSSIASAYNSISQAVTDQIPESGQYSLTYINGTLWASYYAGSWLEQFKPQIQVYASQFNGTSWTESAVGRVNNVAGVYQSRSSIFGVGTTPYIALTENDKSQSVGGQKILVYLKHWNGSSWTLDGTFANRDGGSTYSLASSVAGTSCNSLPYVAWTELTTNNSTNDTNDHAYVSYFSGGVWNSVGGNINNNASLGYSKDISIACDSGGHPWVAFAEHQLTTVAKIYVYEYISAAWTLKGTLNQDATTGYGYAPKIAIDASDNVYVAWVEQQAKGQRPQLYVSKYSGSGTTWNNLGGSLNVNSTGVANHASLVIYGNQPTVAWGELNPGAYRNIYVKKYNGASWDLLPGSAPPSSFSVTVILSGTGGGLVTNTTNVINCGSACVASFVSGTSVTLNATANSGSHFVGWSGACSGTSTSCTFTATTNLTATATFDLDTPPPPPGSGWKAKNPHWKGAIKIH